MQSLHAWRYLFFGEDIVRSEVVGLFATFLFEFEGLAEALLLAGIVSEITSSSLSIGTIVVGRV